MQNSKKYNTTAIILAAGSGSRMGEKITKQKLLIHGESILFRSVKVFQNCPEIDKIVVVCRADETEWAREETFCFDKIFAIIPGGKTRAESAKAGFCAIPDDCEFIAVHDAARCLVTEENISSVLNMAYLHGAATAATPVTDTLKLVSADFTIEKTLSREGLYSAQTPQVFSRKIYAEAIEKSVLDNSVTDDNMLVEKIGYKIHPVNTGKNNIKITTAEDIEYAEYIISRRREMGEIRVGHGYDVHRLAEDRKLVLGGVEIPYELGLLGHSDADVLTHAIMDALLGGAALGDIGRHFPDSDEKYRGISSIELLCEVEKKLSNLGYSIVNIDATVIAERPKLSPYIDQMVQNIAIILKIDSGRINIKATTEEHLGFTGRGEGISSHAVAMIKK